MSAEQDNTEQQQSLPIPAVPKKYGGILGNVPDLDGSFILKSWWELADLYGDIYSLDIFGEKFVVLHNYELINDSADDDRFEKTISGPLVYVRDQIGDGLFTAYNDEKVSSPSTIKCRLIISQNWAMAHRILVPTFGPIGIRKMFDQQLDIASQMILRWDRLGPDNIVIAGDDFTKYVRCLGALLHTSNVLFQTCLRYNWLLRIQLSLQRILHGRSPPICSTHGRRFG